MRGTGSSSVRSGPVASRPFAAAPAVFHSGAGKAVCCGPVKTAASRQRPGARSRGLRLDLSASQALVLSFVALIVLGWQGFLWLPGLYEGSPMGWVDALFISASAVCVTGLSTIDVPVVLSFWGELWLLLLIQSGALGILTFAAMIVRAAGRRAGLDVEEAAGSYSSVLPLGTPGQLLRTILGVTLVCEAIGAVGLTLLWWGEFGFVRSVWLAIFHSVSAFCNAGFSLFSDNLMGQQRNASVLIVIAVLIAVGGIGFPVLHDLRSRQRGRKRLTTHSRLVLSTTGLLIGVGAVGFLLFEWDRQLAGLSFADRVVNSLFMSITPRTAGFNAVDYGAVTNDSIALTMVLMWIGGAPGSVAGGAKVTTVALLALLVLARLRGDRHVSIAGRTVPDETVHRASGLAVGMVLILVAFMMLLLAFEPPGLAADEERALMVRFVFEIQSALSTVGLSMNLTPTLAPGSKLALVAVMILGRVGPLAVLGAMTLRSHHADFRHPHEDVLIG